MTEPVIERVIRDETWIPVVGFQGQYEVSDQGRVRSLDRPVQCPGHKGQKPYVRVIPGKILKPTGANPYLAVYLPRQGATRVHVIVAAAFLGPRPEGWETRHLNGDHLDNRACNLAYGTVSDNQQDAIRHGKNWARNKTHCPQGHEYTPENTHILYKENGWRNRLCKTCRMANARKRSEQRRLKGATS